MLVNHGYGMLIDLSRGAVHARCLGGRRSARQIVHFRGADLIACEIVTWQQNWTQDRVIGINPGIDVGDNATARRIEALLRLREPNDLGRGLIDVACPHG